jgi:hypothetical protein
MITCVDVAAPPPAHSGLSQDGQLTTRQDLADPLLYRGRVFCSNDPKGLSAADRNTLSGTPGRWLCSWHVLFLAGQPIQMRRQSGWSVAARRRGGNQMSVDGDSSVDARPVFVSHASRDIELVSALVDMLRMGGPA